MSITTTTKGGKRYFLSFGGPTSNYHRRVQQICTQANKYLPHFEPAIGIAEKELQQDEFWTLHGSFIHNNPRGYGHWIWKPYLIYKTMREQLNEGDFLIYCDAECTINVYGMQKLEEQYLQTLETTEFGMIVFHRKIYMKLNIPNVHCLIICRYKLMQCKHHNSWQL